MKVKALEFDLIKGMLKDFAVTEYGKAKAENLEPYLSELRLKQALVETDNARAIIDYAGTPHIPDVEVALGAVSIAEKDGLLQPEQLDRLVKFISSCKRLKAYLKKAEQTEKSLAFSGRNIDELGDLQEEINMCINGNQISPNASKALGDIMRRIDGTNSQIKAKLQELLKSKKQFCTENFISKKNDRFTLPVKREHKNQIAGSVIAESSSGTTLYIEPVSVAKFAEKLNLLKTEEEIEKEKILYMLTASVYEYREQIKLNVQTAETLDFAFAKARLSAQMKATTPVMISERRIAIKGGRHPLIELEKCVPVDFQTDKGIRGVVITGPNTGGKTVVLKLIGLFSLMAQCGLHLPCDSAEMCLFNGVVCDIGDGQNISENLSTFSAHIKNIISILEQADKNTLVLLDELGSGTDPAEGMGIAVAVLEELRQRQCIFVTTTHYVEVKEYAQKADGLVNARMLFDKETLRPLYRLVVGEAGESCALYIARKLGFPSSLIKRAYGHTYGTADLPQELMQGEQTPLNRQQSKKIEKIPVKATSVHAESFNIGDSVVVYPEKKLGLIYEIADKNGVLGVQIQGVKHKVNHKRIKLKTPAAELYPPDYDFSIIFDTVANRKARHKMTKGHRPDLVVELTPPDND